MHHKLIKIACFLVVCLCILQHVQAQELTSETDERLQKILADRPQADLNRDGILTLTEVRTFRDRLQERVKVQREKTEKFFQDNPPFQANVQYGPHERNVLDFWKAEGKTPSPLVVYIHGGGWVGGDKSKVSPVDITRFLQSGVSIASISYRYSTIAPYPTPIRDGGLAVQYLRAHADELNIDPTRVACYGGSAGAVTSLWLAFHNDLADPNAEDPVLQQSTRLTCVGANAAPVMLDKQMIDELFGMKVIIHPAFYPFYGVEEGNEQELYSEKIREVGINASPYTLLTADDPPMFLHYNIPHEGLKKDHTAGQMVHHPQFGVALKEKADKLGVKAILSTTKLKQKEYEDMTDFIIQQLTK